MKKRRAAVYAALIFALAAAFLLALAAGSAQVKLPVLLRGALVRWGLGARRSVCCCGCSSARLMERLIFPSGVMASTLTFTVWPTCRKSFTSAT